MRAGWRNAGFAPQILAVAFSLWLGQISQVPAAAAADALVQVDEQVWTNAVDSSSRQYANRLGLTARAGPLFLWMRVRASPPALKALAKDGKLPIYHNWYRISGPELEYDDETDSVALDVGRVNVLSALQYEIQSQGSFTWRTWSMKQNIDEGHWMVEPVYADGSPVLCRQAESKQTLPCAFEVEVR